MTVQGYDLAVQIHPTEVAALLVFWVKCLHFCDTHSPKQRKCLKKYDKESAVTLKARFNLRLGTINLSRAPAMILSTASPLVLCGHSGIPISNRILLQVEVTWK